MTGAAFEEVIDPSTAEAFELYPVATADELDRAVGAARKAQPGWAALGWDARAQCLEQLADAIDAQTDWLATLHTMEQGMPFSQSLLYVSVAARRIRAMARYRIADRILIDAQDRRVTERWHPLGVIAAIAPWNGPLLLGMMKVVTALICGNTIVLKPSELTPLSTLEIGRLGLDLFPAGVFNVVGGGRETGAAMAAHPGFDKISFTGSTATGLAIARASAQFLRPMTLELGGNDAAILLPDGSADALVAAAAGTGFHNNGQFCAAVKRIYAPASMVDEVAGKLAALANGFVLGNGFEPGVTMGPIQNRAQFDKVRAFVADAKAVGGCAVAGGATLDRPGYFMQPTVFTQLTDGHRLVDEEQFGPVIPIVSYDDVDTVISRINAGPYGLTGSIWTADLDHGEAIAARIAVGSAAINRHAAFDAVVPFPLIKQSGMGIDYAEEGLKGTMRMQVMTTTLPPPDIEGAA
ncbi:hypothetical protein A8V01_16055 [Novosphingobium guangzhouense]|uniref:Aldehyde dehydrogenase domain-containing protein n=1 Tax=Novosphingobium guangzhouense TaxID=1850347 RepID=A0A2K2G3E3_9SPHN|nr:hypothetical protein A8V01_16055 [Novosphingobium guangzhouense]